MSQLIKKFIANNAVDGTKIRLNNNEVLKARNAANSADINIIKVNASDRIEFASLPQVTSDAVAANDLVRYSQFAGALDGLKPKAAVAAASTANIDLAVAADPNPVDGYTLQNNDRILLWQQTADEENGIYVAVTATDPTTWVRSADFDAPSEIPGAYTVSENGTLYQGVLFVSLSSPGTIGVDPINFAMRSVSAGANQALSNLTTTNINQDFIFNTGSNVTIQTQNDVSSEGMDIATGSSSAGATGFARLRSGDAIGGASGAVTLASGTSDTAPTGIITIGSGSPSAADINSGSVDLASGTTSGTGNSGSMTMFSGQAVDGSSGDAVVSSGNVSGAGNSGNALLRTGTMNGTGVSGSIIINSGNSFSSSSGDVTINSGSGVGTNSSSGLTVLSSGDATGTGTSGDTRLRTGSSASNSGSISLQTGNASTGSGNVTIATGNVPANIGSGSVTISTATVSGSGVRGSIQLQNGSEGTAGQVWTSTDVNGSGAWASIPATLINNKELFVLSGTDITNQYVDLAHVAKTNSIHFAVKGAPSVIEGASYDYSVSYTGGAGGNTRITFLNDLATGGASALVASDVVVAQYQY